MNRPVLSLQDYPFLDPSHIGEFPRMGYGSIDGVHTHCIVSGTVTSLAQAVSEEATTVQVLDAARFPEVPFTVQVGYELMRVSGITDNVLSVERGYNSTSITAHCLNMAVYEVLSEYIYMLSDEPVKEIRAVYIDGHKQISGFTSYSGQSGDEHTNWPGRAVIAFNTEAFVAPQRVLDTDAASKRGAGEVLAATVKSSSHNGDALKSAGVIIGPDSTHLTWASFASVNGIAQGQTYYASVANDGASAVTVIAAVSDSATGEVLLYRKIEIASALTAQVQLTHSGLAQETHFAIISSGEEVTVSSMRKEVLVLNIPELRDAVLTSEPPVVRHSSIAINDSSVSYVDLSDSDLTSLWAVYSASGAGDLLDQTHSVEVENLHGTQAAVLKLISSESTGQCNALIKQSIAPLDSATVQLTHSGGSWAAGSGVHIEQGALRVKELSKKVRYTTEATLGSRSKVASSSARMVIGATVSADADFAISSSSDYGTVGSLMQSPQHVIKHFLIERMGFTLADIDTASFTSAGAMYATAITGGYSFAFVTGEKIIPSRFVRSLARQCRSSLTFERGKWKLTYLEPVAAVRTITRGELAGREAQFVFNRSGITELANSITAKYRSDAGTKWLAIASDSDAASITKYGTYHKEMEFPAIRSSAMAAHVLAYILSELKEPNLRVTFPVFYEHFDLDVGDTIEIENPLFDGTSFTIERIKRLDKFRAEVEALQW
jgi:hypothetical protein